jgi:hypothetical protein
VLQESQGPSSPRRQDKARKEKGKAVAAVHHEATTGRREEEFGTLKTGRGIDPVDKRGAAEGALKTRAGDGDRTMRFSYRDAVVRSRTFRPRFPPEGSHRRWLNQDSWRKRGRKDNSVWDCLGNNTFTGLAVLDRLSTSQGQLASSEEGSRWLTLLKAKVGDRRCFNCLASDHRIS